MKNYFSLWPSGEAATIWLKRRNGEKVACTVDAEDLEKLVTHRGTWHCSYDHDAKGYYARTNVREGGARTTTSMHRFLVDAPKGVRVLHIDNDTLNNRRYNLRKS